METVGAYSAERAAARSGVQKSTVHYWARSGVLIPSVSPERVRLWSYTDLLGLRTIYWLRQPRIHEGLDVPRSKMAMVRRALHRLRKMDPEIFDAGRPVVAVARNGEVIVTPPGADPKAIEGQILSCDLIAQFDTEEGTHGPDLQRASEFVRILPRSRIADLYPALPRPAVIDALRLERQLASGLRAAA